MSNETTPSSTPRLRRRIFNAPTMLSFVAAVAVFILVSTIVSTNLGVAVAIGAGALAGGLIWWSLSSVARHRQLATVLTNLPDVGPIPTHEALAPAIGDGDAATAYRLAAQGLEERTTGQILLFTSPVPGWGTTTVALNTAIAASRLGRRVVFIDADLTCHGASRFLSTGPEPGLSSLADGTATLPQVARLLTVSTDVRLPVIPPGGPMDDEALLAGPEMGAAIDTMAATADLIIIDAPPVGWSDTTPHLAAHADGSVLVVSPKADPATTVATGERLADIGAPVLAYITNRSERVMTPLGSVWKSLIIRTVAMAVLLAAAFTLFTSGQLWAAWAGIDREEFSLADANVALDATTTTVDPGALPAVDGAHTTAPDPAPDTESPEMFETFLVIGGDEDSGSSDVLLYLVRPTDGTDPFMMSFPRDLYVTNPCTGTKSRINALSHGCPEKDINGPTLLAVEISRLTGIDVDHFAEFTFEGFVDIIDAVGGVEICVGDYDVRDLGEAQLRLPAGCTTANGTQALSWVRSRKTERYKDGVWGRMPGTSDLMRNEHQQDVIVELAKELKGFDSPQALTQIVSSVADAFTLSDTLGLSDAISLAWSMRGIDIEDIHRIEIPVELSRSPSNQSILVWTTPPREVIEDFYKGTLPEGSS